MDSISKDAMPKFTYKPKDGYAVEIAVMGINPHRHQQDGEFAGLKVTVMDGDDVSAALLPLDQIGGVYSFLCKLYAVLRKENRAAKSDRARMPRCPKTRVLTERRGVAGGTAKADAHNKE